MSAAGNPVVGDEPQQGYSDAQRQNHPDGWTSGFPAASFWLLYEFTWHPAWRRAAKAWTAALEGQSTRTDTHDLGFVINNTFGAGYQLTGDAHYADVVLTAVFSLAERYDPDVGATRSWDWGD